MAQLIIMPKLGLTMTEGKVAKWYKNEGDKVAVGDVLFEVATDKITNQVESDSEGILLKRLVPEGDDAPVSAPVGIVGSSGEDISGLLGGTLDAEQKKAEETAAAFDNKSEPAVKNEGNVKASPAAKKLARDNNIDISLIKGTGPEGRIVEKDVKLYIEDSTRKVKVSPAAGKLAADLGVDISSIDKRGRVMKEDVYKAYKPAEENMEDERVIPSGMRKVIAERMFQSWTTSPSVTFNMEADVSKLKAMRDSLKDECGREGVKLSYNHILMKICARALKEFPYINASYDGREIILHKNVNVGLAVSVEGGLLVPNVKGAQSKSLLQIAKETDNLVSLARKGGLNPDDMTGGTFTITNLGMYGMRSFSPIINQPELAILGVNAIVEKPVVENGEVVVLPMMNLSLTADHRVVDGAEAAGFLARIVELIENPNLLLL